MRPTNEGYRFLLGTVLIGLASLNTGNNLIYLIFGLMLSILVISYLALRINLSGLTLRALPPSAVYAGQTARLDLVVRNTKTFWGSYSLRLHLPEGMEGTGHLDMVARTEAATVSLDVLFKRRGLYKYGGFQVESSYPFIFFTRRVSLSVEGEVVVYPEPLDFAALEHATVGAGQVPLGRRGQGDELLMLRSYRQGDDYKKIHWRASAKTGSLMMREYAEEESRSVTILLDNCGPEAPAAFEKCVSIAAALLLRHIAQGAYVRLRTCSVDTAYGAGREQLYRLMDILAVVGEEPEGAGLSREEAGPGLLIAILKSESSPMRSYATGADRVISADRI